MSITVGSATYRIQYLSNLLNNFGADSIFVQYAQATFTGCVNTAKVACAYCTFEFLLCNLLNNFGADSMFVLLCNLLNFFGADSIFVQYAQ